MGPEALAHSSPCSPGIYSSLLTCRHASLSSNLENQAEQQQRTTMLRVQLRTVVPKKLLRKWPHSFHLTWSFELPSLSWSPNQSLETTGSSVLSSFLQGQGKTDTFWRTNINKDTFWEITNRETNQICLQPKLNSTLDIYFSQYRLNILDLKTQNPSKSKTCWAISTWHHKQKTHTWPCVKGCSQNFFHAQNY